MIDSLTRSQRQRGWDHVGRMVAKLGVSANQVTVLGTLAVLLHCLAYPFHGSALAFGLGLAALEETDNLDGAVARVTGTSSKWGAYLDASTDRYKDAAALLAVAWVHDLWLPAFIAAVGAVHTSYAKARAAMEAPVDNGSWPDLFERLERVVLLCGGLAVAGLATEGRLWGVDVVAATVWILAVGTQLTVLQRQHRAWTLLRDAD